MPVGVATFGEDENEGPSLVEQVGFTSRRIGTNVMLVSLVEGLQGILRRMSVVFLGFVVHEGDVEIFLGGDPLHDGVTSVEEGMAVAIPVHHEGVDSHIFGLGDLLAKYVWLLVVVANVNGVTC